MSCPIAAWLAFGMTSSVLTTAFAQQPSFQVPPNADARSAEWPDTGRQVSTWAIATVEASSELLPESGSSRDHLDA